MYLLSLLCLALPCATLHATSHRFNITKDDCFVWEVEYHGGGLENPMVTGVTSPDQCQELCQDRQGCNYFTWVSSQHDVTGYRNTCWLKKHKENRGHARPVCQDLVHVEEALLQNHLVDAAVS